MTKPIFQNRNRFLVFQKTPPNLVHILKNLQVSIENILIKNILINSKFLLPLFVISKRFKEDKDKQNMELKHKKQTQLIIIQLSLLKYKGNTIHFIHS